MNQAQARSDWEMEPSQQSGSALNQIKSTVADKLRSASDVVSQKSSQMAGRNDNISNYGQQAATWLDRSADYVQDFEPGQLKADIEKQVRNNPGRSLLIAGAVGLVIGAILRRR